MGNDFRRGHPLHQQHPSNFGHHGGAGHSEPLEHHVPVHHDNGGTEHDMDPLVPQGVTRDEIIKRKYPSSSRSYSEARGEFPPAEHAKTETVRATFHYERSILRPDMNGAAEHIARGDFGSSVYSGRQSHVVDEARNRRERADLRARDRMKGWAPR